ncbi:unnamed protein product [Caretta caretta]
MIEPNARSDTINFIRSATRYHHGAHYPGGICSCGKPALPLHAGASVTRGVGSLSTIALSVTNSSTCSTTIAYFPDRRPLSPIPGEAGNDGDIPPIIRFLAPVPGTD